MNSDHEVAVENIEAFLQTLDEPVWRGNMNHLPEEIKSHLTKMTTLYGSGKLDPAEYSDEVADKVRDYRKYKVIVLIKEFHSVHGPHVPDPDSSVPLEKKIFEKIKDSVEKDFLNPEDFPENLQDKAKVWMDHANKY